MNLKLHQRTKFIIQNSIARPIYKNVVVYEVFYSIFLFKVRNQYINWLASRSINPTKKSQSGSILGVRGI